MIKEYTRLKTSVISTNKDEAANLLNTFKAEHRDFLNDRALISEFVETTVRSSSDDKQNPNIPSPKMEIMIAIANLLSIFFNAFFQVEWLTGIVLVLILLCAFFMHLIKIDYDFSDDFFFSRMTNFVKNHNICYGLLFLLIFSRCPLSYMERGALIIIQDSLSAIIIFMRGFELLRPKFIAACENVAILVELFYLFVLVLTLLFRFDTQALVYALVMLVFIIIRMKVGLVYLFKRDNTLFKGSISGGCFFS